VGEAGAGLDDDQRAVAVLLTSELVSNAVRHPPRDATGHETEIEVRIQRTGRALRVEVCDHDARPLPQVLRPLTPREGGMGLHIVHELADAWGDHLGPPGEGKVVWFEIRLPDADRAQGTRSPYSAASDD
jgi:anti-sigma regulatory factor (Ser/Thr protein kinase)